MGFDPEWLALREPADHAARDATLLGRAVTAAGPAPVILDLACGTGSTLRAVAPHMQVHAVWRLVDNDLALLEHARDCGPEEVEICHLDLADPTDLPLEDVTLVTASALLDLVSAVWLKEVLARLCAGHLPFYAALSYDGRMIWRPEHEEDKSVCDAFNAHQRTDKGFGPSLGPDAVLSAQELFLEHGFNVTVARSDWEFAPDISALKGTLTRGIAEAAEEAGYSATEEWRSCSATRALRVGHLDLLALPPGSRSS